MPVRSPVTVDSEQRALSNLLGVLDLDDIDDNHFIGERAYTTWPRMFGGHVAGQALVAAGRTVDRNRLVHSLHSYFIRAGDPTRRVLYAVDRLRDGGSFSVRRVVAIQHGEPIFILSASFQLAQSGPERQAASMPAVAAPEELPTIAERIDGYPTTTGFFRSAELPFDLRYVDDPPWVQEQYGPRGGTCRAWIRAREVLPDNPLLHSCVLTYASDITLIESVLVRHGIAADFHGVSVASLDHAVWFERPFRADEWLLFVTESPSASGGRGRATGSFFTQSGIEVARTVQEGVVRIRP